MGRRVEDEICVQVSDNNISDAVIMDGLSKCTRIAAADGLADRKRRGLAGGAVKYLARRPIAVCESRVGENDCRAVRGGGTQCRVARSIG